MDADWLMEEWGFDPEAMDAWAVEQGITRVKNVSEAEWTRAYARFAQTGQRF
jgi:hypothetical protein